MARDGSEEAGSDSDEGSATHTEDEFIDKHHCTDVPCGIAFVAAVVLFVGIFVWGWGHSDLRKLSRGIDKDGQICGVSAPVADKRFLYYCAQELSLSNWSLDIDERIPVCVPACPSGPNASAVDPPVVPECPVQEQQGYLTKRVAEWYCYPEESKFGKAAIEVEAQLEIFKKNAVSPDFFGIFNSWPVLLAVVVLATVLGYLYLFLLRALAKGLLWLCVVLSMVGLTVAGYFLWVQEGAPATEFLASAAGPLAEGTMESASSMGKDEVLTRRVLAIVLWAAALGVACLACCCSREVQLSTACIQTGTEVIWKMPLLLLAPLVKALVKAGLLSLFVVGYTRLFSTAEVHGTNAHRRYDFTPTQWLLMACYIFVGWWILVFVTALYQFSVAYAVAKYYASPLEEDGGKEVDGCGVVEGVRAGLHFHIGSLAFGSALITVLELAQKVLEYAELKNKEEGNNQVVACLLSTVLCCCKCLEGVVQFVSKNAYISMAITSASFCRSVQNVAHTVIDHGAAMLILNGATTIFQVVGVFAITVLCGLFAHSLLRTQYFSNPFAPGRYVSSPNLATAAACLLGLIVSWAFMTVFDVATDTLLFCYAEDADRHGGHAANAPAKMRDLYERAQQKVAKAKRDAEAKAQEQQGRPRFAR